MNVKFLYNVKSPGIYSIINTMNGNMYIGSAAYMYTRLRCHISLLNRCKHPNTHLQRAWNKYGENNFKVVICELCAKDLLEKREQYHIDNTNSSYNIMKDVIRLTHSQESKNKMSETWKKFYKENPNSGHHCTKINQFDLNGDFIRQWNSLKEAAKTLKIGESTIAKCLNKTLKTAGDFQWYYPDDKNILKVQNKRERCYKKILCIYNDGTSEIFDSVKNTGIQLNVNKDLIPNIIRNKVKRYRNKFTLQYLDLVKQGELLEKPEVVNQQPSLSSDTLEGSTTNSQIQN